MSLVVKKLGNIQKYALPLKHRFEVQPSEPPSYSEHLAFLAEACDNAFSEEEMQVIFDIIVTLDIPTHPDGIDFARYHYLKQKYSEMKLQAAKRKITNRFAYFKAMLKQ